MPEQSGIRFRNYRDQNCGPREAMLTGEQTSTKERRMACKLQETN